MTSRSLAKISGDLFADALSTLGIPANMARSLFAQWLERRAAEARDIIISELAAARIEEFQAASEDDAIAVVYRYMLAARDCAARRNLRLLARSIAGLAQRDRLHSDEFNKYAEALSRLSRDEILVIGALHRFRTTKETGCYSVGTAQYWQPFIKEMVPAQFASEDHVVAVCCSGLRSGLLLTPRDFDSSGYYTTSPLMDEVAELAEFEAVLVEEEGRQ